MTYTELDQEALEWWFAQPLAWRAWATQRHTPKWIWRLVYDRSGQPSRVFNTMLAQLAVAFEKIAPAANAFAEQKRKHTNDEAAAHRARSMKKADKSLPWN